jgi:hypothetical protein
MIAWISAGSGVPTVVPGVVPDGAVVELPAAVPSEPPELGVLSEEHPTPSRTTAADAAASARTFMLALVPVVIARPAEIDVRS